MGPVTRALDEPPVALGTADPMVLGTACCVFAALGYTVTNICLRSLAETAPVAWTVCVRELVGMAGVAPWILWSLWRGVRCLPDCRSLGVLVAAGLATELVGNLGLMWALGVIGLSVAIPIVLGGSLVFSAALGWLVLGERVSRRSCLALAVLIVSIVVLKLGADQGPRLLEVGPTKVLLAVAVTVAAGGSYAWLSVAVRSAAMAGTPLPGIVLVITGMGIVTLGPFSLWQLGPAGLWATPPREMSLMLLAGAVNFVSFLAIAKGLHLTTVVHANVLSASQAAMAAVAGILLFGETPNGWIVLGVVLTVVGMVFVERPSSGEDVMAGV
jgi:drug/metabolite transporter, DME family